MHLAEELIARFQKNRKALAAMALCDPTAITCAANDFGYDQIFSRQIEGLGNPGDVLIVFSTSGNSTNIVRALEAGRANKLITAGFLGRDGGNAKPLCDIPIVVPAPTSNRIQEGHKILYHVLCEWVDQRVD
jgi:D-sedoheptulose 7-phosphate isomerase